MSGREELADAFAAIVDGVRLDDAHLGAEWRERTAYGRVRLVSDRGYRRASSRNWRGVTTPKTSLGFSV